MRSRPAALRSRYAVPRAWAWVWAWDCDWARSPGGPAPSCGLRASHEAASLARRVDARHPKLTQGVL